MASDAHVLVVTAAGVAIWVDGSDVPGALPLLFGLIGGDVAEFDQQLREGHLLLRGLLRVELQRWRTVVRIVAEAHPVGQVRFGIHEVGVLVLRLSEGSFQRIRAGHSVVDVVHVGWQFVHCPLVVPGDCLGHGGKVGDAGHLLLEPEGRGGNSGERRVVAPTKTITLSPAVHNAGRQLHICRLAEVEHSLSLAPYDIDLVVVEARLAHRNAMLILARNLLVEVELGHMFLR